MQIDDIVQITNAHHHWHGGVLIVDQVKPWGVIAYIIIPKDPSRKGSVAFIRLKTEDISYVGHAKVSTMKETKE